MKAIMLSVQPQWLEMILNKTKTIEIRNSIPKCNLPIDVYLYCTKSKIKLYFGKIYRRFLYGLDNKKDKSNSLNGKVVAKFTLNKVEEVLTAHHIDGKQYDRVVKKSCIDYELFEKYVGEKEQVYAWHIDNLVIFDTPKELSDFERQYAPQSWCYVEVKEVIENDK